MPLNRETLYQSLAEYRIEIEQDWRLLVSRLYLLLRNYVAVCKNLIQKWLLLWNAHDELLHEANFHLFHPMKKTRQ